MSMASGWPSETTPAPSPLTAPAVPHLGRSAPCWDSEPSWCRKYSIRPRHRCHDLDLLVPAQRGVEARAPVGVTGRAGLPDQQQQAITVAIDTHLDEVLGVARGLALDPECLPRATPIRDAARLERPRHGVGVHPRHHQHFARFVVLRDGGDQPVRVASQRGRVERHDKILLHPGHSRLFMGQRHGGKAMSGETDLIKLYSGRILELAADIPRHGRLSDPQATVRRRAPLCGSTVTVDLGCDGGRVSDYAAEVKACALGQAAASVVGANIIGRTRDEVAAARDALRAMLKEDGPTPPAPFDGLEVLRPARDYKNRHASILLTLEAATEALDEIAARSPCA